MQKVTDIYSPEIARHTLEKHFSATPAVLETIGKMHKTSLCMLAALCDGNVVTTSGYEIAADLCVNRASAVAHSLKLKLFPISTRAVSTRADVGGEVRQAAFYIENADLEMLKAKPEKVMKECEKNLNGQKRTNAQKDMTRLYREFGEDGVMELLHHVANMNLPPAGTSPSL